MSLAGAYDPSAREDAATSPDDWGGEDAILLSSESF